MNKELFFEDVYKIEVTSNVDFGLMSSYNEIETYTLGKELTEKVFWDYVKLATETNTSILETLANKEDITIKNESSLEENLIYPKAEIKWIYKAGSNEEKEMGSLEVKYHSYITVGVKKTDSKPT